MTALIAAIARLVTGLLEVVDHRMASLSYRWGWR